MHSSNNLLLAVLCRRGITDYRILVLAERETNMVLFGRLLPIALAWVGLRAAQGLDSGVSGGRTGVMILPTD